MRMFILGLIVGDFIGIFTMCLAWAAKDGDDNGRG